MPEKLYFQYFKMAPVAILDLQVKMASKLYDKYLIGFFRPELVENDTSFVFLLCLVPEILYFLYFKMASAAILDSEFRMLLKLYGRYFLGILCHS